MTLRKIIAHIEELARMRMYGVTPFALEPEWFTIGCVVVAAGSVYQYPFPLTDRELAPGTVMHGRLTKRCRERLAEQNR
jgi:hypothetical protein